MTREYTDAELAAWKEQLVGRLRIEASDRFQEGANDLLLEAADMIERLQAALEGTHFHHKMFEPLCRTCCAALFGPVDETSDV